MAHEDHARRECHAALAIQRATRAYREKIERECGVDFRMRIGLNSGPVIVGSIGDDLRMNYTAVAAVQRKSPTEKASRNWPR